MQKFPQALLASTFTSLSTLLATSLSLIAVLTSSTVLAQGTPLPVEALPLGKDIGIKEGQSVTPAYEGWYENADGTISLSFGYYNRNSEEVMEIPVGPANRIIGTPDGEADHGQPAVFYPHRHWGVFTVTVPADYEQEVLWHLENRGKTFHIPANLNTDYVIDAIAGDANGNFPPEVRFTQNGEMGHGPAGITTGPLQATTGEPLNVDIWVKDDGIGSGLMAMFLGGGEGKPPVDVAWFKQQGPGQVTFSDPATKVPVEGGKASTTVTFSEPGQYLLRARVTEFSGPETAGHAQCCWSNGFVRVNVSN